LKLQSNDEQKKTPEVIIDSKNKDVKEKLVN